MADRLKWLKRDQTADSSVCFGTDPDRNYNVDWGKYGSSSVCSEFYAGPKSLSEPETKALATFLDENKKTISVSEFQCIKLNYVKARSHVLQ